jgi:hypothetical protein
MAEPQIPADVILIPAENRVMLLDPKPVIVVRKDGVGADGKPLEKSR